MAKRQPSEGRYSMTGDFAMLAKFCGVAAIYREGVAGGIDGTSELLEVKVIPHPIKGDRFIVRIIAPPDTHRELAFAGFIRR